MNRSLDREIAEKVMGEVEAHAPVGDGLTRTSTYFAPTLAECDADIRRDYGKSAANGRLWPAQYCGPNYSESWDAAAQVVEKMREKGFDITLGTHATIEPYWSCEIFYALAGVAVQHCASTAPEAICRAALSALASRDTVVGSSDLGEGQVEGQAVSGGSG